MTVPRRYFFCGPFCVMLYVCLCYAVLSIPCSLVVTCCERDDLLALLYVAFFFIFVIFQYVSWSTSELRVRLVPLDMFKPSSHVLLTNPRQCYSCKSFIVVYVSWLSLLCFLVCSLQSCDSWWQRADLLALWGVSLFFGRFPIWCPRPAVVLYCINFWTLLSFLL